MKLQVVHFMIFSVIYLVEAATEEEKAKCNKDLADKMQDMKTWLQNQLIVGAKEGCKREILDKKLTEFGMAKIECDKAGTNTLFDFPAKEYKAWEALCPQPALPKFQNADNNAEAKEKSTKDKKKGKKEKKEKPRDDDDEDNSGEKKTPQRVDDEL